MPLALPAMRRSDRRSHAAAAGPGKAALEEQPNGAFLEGVPGVRGDPVPEAAVAHGARRSTESEVYDDGTNTFFW